MRAAELARRWLLACCFALPLAIAPACSDDAEPDQPLSCEAAGVSASMQRVAADDVAVYVDVAASDDQIALFRADLESYLGALWSVPVSVRDGAPSGSERFSIWLTTDPSAQAIAGDPPSGGYVMRRSDEGEGARFVVHAESESALISGGYAFLEELGVRFFHPKQELVPALGSPHLPRKLEIARRPAFAVRGLQLHLLHPTEWFRPFNEPSPENLADAKRLIDWLVKTGQNHVQWWLLRTMDLDAHRPHAQAIIDYAHSRGVTVGALVQLWGGASLQNSFDLISSQADWQTELEAGLDFVLQNDWDLVELSLGEFLAGDPAELVAWLDHATAYVHAAHPGVEISVVNHVGNYPDLWIDWQGQETFFYHVPGFADPRLINNVHTVFFYDLFRPKGGYEHPDFSLHREFIEAEVGERKVRYLPESAYWATADVDVPVFLPMYAYSRWVDINGLTRELSERGLPPLDGHVMFTSGHEWGYWLTDYLAAKMMWQPEQPFEFFVDDYARAFGDCRGEVSGALSELVKIQNEYLFDRDLSPYVHGEDRADDAGALLGIYTHAPRVPFQDLLAMSETDLTAFESDVIAPVAEAADETAAVAQRFERVCAASDEALGSWCRELEHGAKIVELRLAHSAALYRAVIARARGGDAAPLLEEAAQLREDARIVIDARGADYRFPLAALTAQWENATIYDFGYLRQAHELCFWERQHAQAQGVIEDGAPPGIGQLPTCDR